MFEKLKEYIRRVLIRGSEIRYDPIVDKFEFTKIGDKKILIITTSLWYPEFSIPSVEKIYKNILYIPQDTVLETYSISELGVVKKTLNDKINELIIQKY